jgi:hypothetical protein
MTDPDRAPLWVPDSARPPVADADVVDGTVVDDDPGLAAAAATGTEMVPVPPAAAHALIAAPNPAAMIEQATAIATACAAIIERQGMRVNMGTRDKPRWHVEVEGWQTLGTLLGLTPALEWARPWVSPETGKPDRVRYTARVEHYEGRGQQRRIARVTTYDVDGYSWEARLVIRRGEHVFGEAEALCSRKEARWGRADDYAIKSMAITRATSRAYKQAAGWVIALAGYEATPAAEVDPNTGQVLPYGPDASGDLIARLRKAGGYLIAGDTADEETYEAVQDWITAVHGDTGGYVPAVVARAVVRLAVAARDANTTDPSGGTE